MYVDYSTRPELWDAQFSGQSTITDQGDLTRFYAVVEAIEAGNGSGLPSEQTDFYLDVMTTMIAQMETRCVELLTGEGVECTPFSAELACTQRVVRPAEANYLNLDLGASYVRPNWTATPESGQGADGSCYGDTDGGPGGGTDPSGGDPDTSPGTSGDDGNSGADVTGTSEGAAPDDPFGDLDTLVHCNDAKTSCTYDKELVDNVMGAADQFTHDGATMTLLKEKDAGFPGVRLDGLRKSDTPSAELAAAFGLRDGDVIRSVDGTTLKSADEALAVAEKLLASGKATVTYRRRGKSRTVELGPR